MFIEIDKRLFNTQAISYVRQEDQTTQIHLRNGTVINVTTPYKKVVEILQGV